VSGRIRPAATVQGSVASHGGGPRAHTVACTSSALARGHHAREGAVAEGPMLASLRQGVAGEFMGTTGRARATRAEARLTEGGGRL
jgi:hypothetical protein